MNQVADILDLAGRVLLPVTGLAVLVVLSRWGVFDAAFLAAGPRRRLRLPWPLAVIGMAAVLLAAVPGVGSLPAAAIFVALVAAWPGAVRALGLRWSELGRAIGPGVGLGVAVGLLATAVNVVAGGLGEMLGDPPDELGHAMLRALVEEPSLDRLVSVVLLAVVLAPLVEEAAYRGLAQSVLGDRLGRRERWTVVLVVAGLFAVAHAAVVTWHAMPGLFVLGVGFGAAYERTGSLWVPVVMHCLFNAANIAVVMVFMV